MKNDTTTEIVGHVRDVFAHRFVIEKANGERVLADLGPEGAKAFSLNTNIEIVVSGEMKPSELKVATIAIKGGRPVVVGHRKDKLDRDRKAGEAIDAVVQAGFEVLGEPRRKPQHFEVLGRKDGNHVECHVEFDGTIREERPVETGDDKWASEMKSAA